MAGSIYPGQASLLDQTDSWNHRQQEISMWQPNVEDSAALDLRGIGQVLPTHLMEERLIRQQQEMEEDQRWLEKEERFLKPDVRPSRGSMDREDGSLQGPVSDCPVLARTRQDGHRPSLCVIRYPRPLIFVAWNAGIRSLSKASILAKIIRSCSAQPGTGRSPLLTQLRSSSSVLYRNLHTVDTCPLSFAKCLHS